MRSTAAICPSTGDMKIALALEVGSEILNFVIPLFLWY